MAKKFKISQGDAIRLKSFLEGMKAQDVIDAVGGGEMKAIRHLVKVCEEIESSVPKFAAVVSSISAKINKDVIAPYREKMLKNIQSDEPQEQINEKNNILISKMNAAKMELDTKLSEKANFAEEYKKEATVTIGNDDRFETIKTVFDKSGAGLEDKNIIARISEALDSAEEA